MLLKLFTFLVFVWWKHCVKVCYYSSLPNSAFSDVTHIGSSVSAIVVAFTTMEIGKC